jgi:hypothetical protein
MTFSAVANAARKAFSFPVFLGVALIAGGYWGLAYHDLPAGKIFYEGDTWWHLAVGERILSTGHWPTSDIYSFTAFGNAWVADQWLGEVILALAMRWGGSRGLAVLLTLLSAVFLGLLFYYSCLRSGKVKAAVLACVAMLPMASTCLTLRPQLVGYIFLPITLICLEYFHQGHAKALWVLPLVFLFWVNTHGTFVLGLAVMAAYGVSRLKGFRLGKFVAQAWSVSQRRQLAVVSLICLLVLPLTPYGTRLAAFPFDLMFLHPEVSASVTEWHPMPFSQPLGFMFLGLVLVAIAALLFLRREFRVEEVLFLLVAVGEATLHMRFVVFFVILFTPFLAALLAPWMPAYEATKDRPILNAALIAAVFAGITLTFPSPERLQRALAREYPQGAVEYLRRHPVPRGMFNEETWGGYLVWALGPDHKVFVDGRAELYDSPGVISDFFEIVRPSHQTPSLLRKYGIEAFLLHRGKPLEKYLASQPAWETAYQDDVSVLFVRKPPQ